MWEFVCCYIAHDTIGDTLHIPPAANYPQCRSWGWYDLTNSSLSCAEIIPPTAIPGTGANADKLALEMLVFNPNDGGQQLCIGVCGAVAPTTPGGNDGKPGTMYYQNRVNYVDPNGVSEPYNPLMSYWRLIESGGFVQFQLSPDGVFWDTRYTSPTPSWANNCRISLSSYYTGGSGQVNDAIMDRVNIVPPPYAGGNIKRAAAGSMELFQDPFDTQKNAFPYWNWAAVDTSKISLASSKLNLLADAGYPQLTSLASWNLQGSYASFQLAQQGGGITPASGAGLTVSFLTGRDGTSLAFDFSQDGQVRYENRNADGFHSFTDPTAVQEAITLTQLASPVATATASTTGGTLAANTYYYKVTAVNAIGETLPSAEVSATTTGTTGSVAVTWPAITGAAGYKVYRGVGGGAENAVASVAGTSYTDTGTGMTSGAPPANNTTANNWFRLQCDGPSVSNPQVRWQRSNDGLTWVTRYSQSAPAWTYLAQPQINTYNNGGTGTATPWRIDNWNIPPNAPVVPPPATHRTSGGKLATFTETFSGNTVDTGVWALTGGARQSNGAIVPAMTNDPMFASVKSYDLTGSSGYVSLVGPQPSVGGNALAIPGDGIYALVNDLDVTQALRFTVTGGQLIAQYDNGAIADSGSTSVPYDPSTMAQLRLIESGGTVSWQYRRLDGGTIVAGQADTTKPAWTTLRTIPTPTWVTTVWVKLAGHLGGTVTPPNPLQLAFTYFNTARPTTTVTPNTTANPLSSTLRDTFDGTSLNAGKWSVLGSGILVNNDVAVPTAPSGAPGIVSNGVYQLDTFSTQMTPPVNVAERAMCSMLSEVTGTAAQFVVTNGQLVARLTVADLDSKAIAVAWDPTKTFYVRFRFSGNTLLWEYSLSGATWVALRSEVAPSWVNAVRFSLTASGQQIATPQSTPIPVPVTNPVPTSNTSAPPAGATITVDFRTLGYPLDKWSVGSTISTYSGAGNANILKSDVWYQRMKALGPMAWRIQLRWAGGNPGAGADNARTSGDAVTYINKIRAMGGTPYVSISGDADSNGFSNSDVAGLVHYFNDNSGVRAGGKLERITLGNEPNNDGNVAAYLSSLAGWIAAAKTADPSLLINAPASAWWDPVLLQTVATQPGVDIVSYHAYDGGATDGSGYPNTAQYAQHINDLRNMKGGLKYGVEAFNWYYQAGSSAFTDWHNLLFISSVIGRVLSAGGHANTYSDSNGVQGIANDGSGQGQPGAFGDPLPHWVALGMWTGFNGMLRRYGSSTVACGSQLPDVEVYADNGGKVMLLNKSATTPHAVTVGLGGKSSGVYTAWQTSQSAPTSLPTKVIDRQAYSGSLLTIALPAGTVTSLELD